MEGIQRQKVELLYSKMEEFEEYVCPSWNSADNTFTKDNVKHWLDWSPEDTLDTGRMKVCNDIWEQVK